MTRPELAAAIRAKALLEGNFRLRSGERSSEYFDKYRFESEPSLLHAIAWDLSFLVPQSTELLAGLELGGVPLATALSLHTGLPCVFVRKRAKEYGTRCLVEGADVNGRRVLVVEDVVTSGGQVMKSTEDLRELGAIVEHAVCVIDRCSGGRELLRIGGVQLQSLFVKSDIAHTETVARG